MPVNWLGETETTVVVPWADIAVPPSTERAIVHVLFGGDAYNAEYGGDPTDASTVGEAVIIDGGGTWRQSKGYFYIWGYWRLLDTDRTRTITWGTTVIGRFVPPSNGLPDREQIFVECGRAVVIPKGSGGQPKVVKAGEYVVANGSGAGVQLSDPKPTPSSTMLGPSPEEQSIIGFLALVRGGHPDPCNP